MRANFLRLIGVIFALTTFTGAAKATCNIFVKVKNTSPNAVDVSIYTSQARVKSKGGTWRGLINGGWMTHHIPNQHRFRMEPGAETGDTYQANQGCDVRRTYEITYTCKGGRYANSQFVRKYPSTNWTKLKTVLIELGRCK